MSRVELRSVSKRYPRADDLAVKQISFEIPDGELVVILGPSGCGKTTTLRMLAGLEGVTSGEILFDGKPVQDTPPAARNIAMAFENYGLYEQWDVFDNIAYPLRLRSVPDAQIESSVTGIASGLGIADYLGQRPGALSGGVRQRIGLARALVRDPSVFLLDEPMSHVDADGRNDMRLEIRRIHERTGATMVIVTHDQEDALMMADRILIMNEGGIEQYDTPRQIYDAPATAFVAGFVGEPPMNILSVSRSGDSLDGAGFAASIPYGLDAALVPGRQLVAFRPHLTRIVSGPAAGAAGGLVLTGQVYMVEPFGERTIVTVQVGQTRVKVESRAQESYDLDSVVSLLVRTEDLHVFADPAGSGRGERF
jgi:ABC-type sugar transport system ATPase subunit